MDIVIDVENVQPLFAQLVAQIKKAVANEEIVAGAPLPSIRQLANDLDLNSKTVAKAYKLLERDSIIQSKGYRGSFVHPDAKSNCDVNIQAHVTKILSDAVSALKDLGATDSELRIAFNDVMTNKVS